MKGNPHNQKTRWQEINIVRFNKIESGEEKGEETNFLKKSRSEEI
jgi:hypothetical protein